MDRDESTLYGNKAGHTKAGLSHTEVNRGKELNHCRASTSTLAVVDSLRTHAEESTGRGRKTGFYLESGR